MHLRKALAVLSLLAFVLPASAAAASLTANASGGVILAQGLDTSIDIGLEVDGGTSTPSEGSAGDDATITTDALFMTSVDVASDEDLERYETSMQGSDSYFAEANFASESEYDIAYYHDGRLFGFIPMKVKSHTKISTNDEGQVIVQTRLPWWNMFVTGTSDVAADVDSRLAASGSVANDMKLGGSAAAKARILEAVAQAHAQARISAAQ